MSRLWHYLRRRFLCRHQWLECGGPFGGAERVCHRCGAWDAMTGVYYWRDYR